MVRVYNRRQGIELVSTLEHLDQDGKSLVHEGIDHTLSWESYAKKYWLTAW